MQAKNLIGQTNGKFKIVALSQIRKDNRISWIAKCSCGIEIIVTGTDWRRGRPKFCKCDEALGHYLIKDLTGCRFGKLLVVRIDPSNSSHKTHWICECDCGKEISARGTTLRAGKINSCGCLRLEKLKETMVTHGKSRTTEYRIWAQMKRRCSPKEKGRGRKDYYERGIRVCKEWSGADGFTAFIEHVGPRPSMSHSLDRIDNDRGYEPGNVRWATPQEQYENQRKRLRMDQISDNDLILELIRRGLKI